MPTSRRASCSAYVAANVRLAAFGVHDRRSDVFLRVSGRTPDARLGP
jgi:hypothetical protein